MTHLNYGHQRMISSSVVRAASAAGGGTLFLMLEDNSGSYELEDGSGGTLLEA